MSYAHNGLIFRNNKIMNHLMHTVTWKSLQNMLSRGVRSSRVFMACFHAYKVPE